MSFNNRWLDKKGILWHLLGESVRIESKTLRDLVTNLRNAMSIFVV